MRNLPIIFFILIWLLPVLYYGFVNSAPPWLPETLQRRANVSRLFSNERKAWAIYLVQFRRASQKEFETLDESLFFRMKPFGQRTRLQRIISLADERQKKELCRWLQPRLEAALDTRIASIRIAVFPNNSVPDRLSSGYTQPAPETIDSEKLRIVVEENFPTP